MYKVYIMQLLTSLYIILILIGFYGAQSPYIADSEAQQSNTMIKKESRGTRWGRHHRTMFSVWNYDEYALEKRYDLSLLLNVPRKGMSKHQLGGYSRLKEHKIYFIH